MAVSTQDVVRWVDALQRVFVENRELLTELDSALGDGDCGVSMERGFTAAQAELSAQPPPRRTCPSPISGPSGSSSGAVS